jgi:hypothetical protein
MIWQLGSRSRSRRRRGRAYRGPVGGRPGAAVNHRKNRLANVISMQPNDEFYLMGRVPGN